MEFFKKLKNSIAISSNNPPPGCISGQRYNLERYMHPSVHSSTIYIAKMWKQPKCPLADDWIKMYVHNGILLSHRKE